MLYKSNCCASPFKLLIVVLLPNPLLHLLHRLLQPLYEEHKIPTKYDVVAAPLPHHSGCVAIFHPSAKKTSDMMNTSPNSGRSRLSEDRLDCFLELGVGVLLRHAKITREVMGPDEDGVHTKTRIKHGLKVVDCRLRFNVQHQSSFLPTFPDVICDLFSLNSSRGETIGESLALKGPQLH